MAQGVPSHVHIVDDDPAVRETIAVILRAAGFTTQGYATAAELLDSLEGLAEGCIVTDVNMPGMNGIELVHHLKARGVEQPVIVISGQADVPMAVEAMKAGALEFLEKPLRSEPIRDAVTAAMRRSTATRSPEAERYVRVVESLTRRQREVLTGILEGLPNKLIAHRLGLSVRTVEAYRAAIMERTQAKSLSELVRLGIMAGL
jgi:two-component system, LuxR family, response regulator FixJ